MRTGRVTSKHNTGSRTGAAESRSCWLCTASEGGQRAHLSHSTHDNNMHLDLHFTEPLLGVHTNEYVLRAVAFAMGWKRMRPGKRKGLENKALGVMCTNDSSTFLDSLLKLCACVCVCVREPPAGAGSPLLPRESWGILALVAIPFPLSHLADPGTLILINCPLCSFTYPVDDLGLFPKLKSILKRQGPLTSRESEECARPWRPCC